jgi:Succinate dehydrogenase/fumarate reductase, flavoprotein subunit
MKLDWEGEKMAKMIEADIAVMGSGATGLAAALTAAEAGAKVVVFEKQKSLGGTSNFFNGTFAVESKMQRENFIMYSKDEAFKAIMEFTHWRANARLVRTIVNESPNTIAWLQKCGVEFFGVITIMPHGPRTYHHVKGHGAALIKVLADRAMENGVEFHMGTPVTGLLKEGNRVVGVIAEEDGEEIEVAAKAVVIASGGYANNKEWMKKYNGLDIGTNIFPVGNVDKMGDGIRLAWEAGAASAGMEALEMFAIGPFGPDFEMMNDLELTVLQPDLWVDPLGRRYCDEGIAFFDTSVGNVNSRYKEATYRIIDDTVIGRIETQGLDKHAGSDIPPGSCLYGVRKVLDVALERGSSEVCMGNTVEELAKNMGVDPAVLRKTVEDYNLCCEQRYDFQFAKDPKFLRALKGPRYYAVKAHTICIGTKGGIKINEKMEVVDKKESPIKGLYGGGLDAGGMYGDCYPFNSSPGLSSAYAINSGRIAGRNATEYVLENR